MNGEPNPDTREALVQGVARAGTETPEYVCTEGHTVRGFDLGVLLRSSMYRTVREQAERLLKHPDEARALLKEAASRLQEAIAPGGQMTAIREEVLTLIRLTSAYMNRTYTDLPWQSIVAALAALVYLVMPFDALPDFIPLGGFLDDAAVLGFVIKSIRDDLRRFRWWEEAHRSPPRMG